LDTFLFAFQNVFVAVVNVFGQNVKMATVSVAKPLPESGIKCRQCRSGFLIEQKEDEKFQAKNDLYVFKDDSLPDWIMLKVEEVSKKLPSPSL
jgi:hypothetical protein